jgi:hypothetical protein
MKVIDRNGFMSMPAGKSIHLVMAVNGVTKEELMMATLVDEEINPDSPIYLFYRPVRVSVERRGKYLVVLREERDGMTLLSDKGLLSDEGKTVLIATQENEHYRDALIATREGRQLDDPLVTVVLTAVTGSEVGH